MQSLLTSWYQIIRFFIDPLLAIAFLAAYAVLWLIGNALAWAVIALVWLAWLIAPPAGRRAIERMNGAPSAAEQKRAALKARAIAQIKTQRRRQQYVRGFWEDDRADEHFIGRLL